jgi:hypothetical protein
MTALPSIDLSPFVVFVYPVGATTPSYPNLSDALRTARQLEAVGHHISAIKNDTTILEGVKLRAMLGERPQRPSLFPRAIRQAHNTGLLSYGPSGLGVISI